METFYTKYGLVTLLSNDYIIKTPFTQNNYWDEDTLMQLKQYIDPNRNILEIGGHCGTSSIVYASFLNEGSKVFVYEPQSVLFSILTKNIQQNNLQHKIVPFNCGVFCYKGPGIMNAIDLDGGGGTVSRRYTDESTLNCNFGGIGLGTGGEEMEMTTIDDMNLDNIGFIHCDAQGSENFIFSRGVNTISKYRPVIYYEDNERFARYLYDNVCNAYPIFKTASRFRVDEFCAEKLNYSTRIERFNGGLDTLLIP